MCTKYLARRDSSSTFNFFDWAPKKGNEINYFCLLTVVIAGDDENVLVIDIALIHESMSGYGSLGNHWFEKKKPKEHKFIMERVITGPNFVSTGDYGFYAFSLK